MHTPDLPADEDARLASLRSLDILDSDPEERFDRIARIAARTFDVPIALVSLVDVNRQWFKSCVGLGASETGRDVSFCGHAILGTKPFVIEDALLDERFRDNPLVTGEPVVRFYAGVPLDDGHGHKLGTLCVIDHEPRTFGVDDRAVLTDLASLIEDELLTEGLRATRETLDRRDGLYRSVVSVLSEGLVVIDSERTVMTFNEAAVKIVGVSPEEGEPMPALPWVGLDLEKVDPQDGPVGRTLRFGERNASTLGLEQVDGSHKWMHINTCPVTVADDGLPELAAIVIEDVTERIELDSVRQEFMEALRVVNDELTRSNQDLEQFAYIASHDLQTPVRNITNAVVLLRDVLGEQMSDEAEEYLGFMDSAAARMKLLIEDLLEYSRVGRAELDLSRPVSLADVVDDICYARSSEIEARSATVSHDVLPDVRVDPGQIRQLLDNLIGNALKYQASERPPEVEVSAHRDGERWRIAVSDNGLGIEEQFRDRVFEMFRRLHRFEEYEGSGIGLAICRRIVEMHGGEIWVEESPTSGSVFAFTLADPTADPVSTKSTATPPEMP